MRVRKRNDVSFSTVLSLSFDILFCFRGEKSGENNGPLGIFTRIEIRVTCWADVFANHSPVSDAERGSAKRHQRDNRKFAVRYRPYPIAFGFWCFFANERKRLSDAGKIYPAWIMRLSDITAGVRAIGTAHCYNRATMHRLAKCRYEVCDQKIGKQRENKPEEEKNAREMDSLGEGGRWFQDE